MHASQHELKCKFMKMLNIHYGSKITCEPQPPPSTLDLAPESSASGAARPWEVQDHLVLCSEHLLWGGPALWLATFPVLHPEGVGPSSFPHLWLPLFGEPRYRARGGEG